MEDMKTKMFGNKKYILDSVTKCKECNKKLRWWEEPKTQDIEQDNIYFSADEILGDEYEDYWFCSSECFYNYIKKHLGNKNPPTYIG